KTGLYYTARYDTLGCEVYKLTDSLISQVSQITSETEVSVFPNPFTTQLTFNITDNEPTTITLFNFLGQQLLQQTFTNSTTIHTRQLQNGIYFYELRNHKRTIKTGKVVKQ
ncbi:MAG: T9SS type A sorting domain-containing protein, partial [Bacteroidota bacterium]